MRRRVLGSVLLVLALVAASCGSDDDESAEARGPIDESPRASESAGAPGITADSVRVALVNPSSGPVGAQFGPYVDGVKARIKKFNDDGGVHGRKVELVIEDDAGDPTRAKAIFDKLVEDDVFGIISGTFWIDVAAEDLAAAGIPVVGWGFTSSYKKFPNFFGEGPATFPDDETRGLDTIARFALERGATKMANLALADPYGPPNGRVQAKVFEKLGGEVVLEVLDLPLVNADFTAIVQRIKETGADYIHGGFNQQTAIAFGKALHQANVKPKAMILGQGYEEEVLKALGPAAEGVSFLLQFAPFELELPAHKAYEQALKEVAPNAKRGIQSLLGWMGADAFLKGLDVAGPNPTREGFIEELRQVKDYTTDGLQGPLDFSTAQAPPEICNFIVTGRDGVFEPESSEPICGDVLTGL